MASLIFMGFITLLVASLSASQNCVAPSEPVRLITYRSSKNYRDASVAAVARSINTFTANFMKEAGSNDAESFICSPMSVWLTLMMLALGAGGETSIQFQKVLQLPDDDRQMFIGIQTLIDSFNSSKGIELRLAQKLFVPTTSSGLNSLYTASVTQTFRAEPQGLDFQDAECASNVINKWCENETNGRIKNIVKQGDFSQYTSLVVASAVYFKGSWQYKFDPKNTIEDNFYSPTGIKRMQFMYQQTVLFSGILRDLNATFVELPYTSEDTSKPMSMFIVLPNPNVDLDYVEEQLEKIPPIRFIETGDTSKINLHLPKFTIESEFNLEEILKCMGLTAMFDDPDFSLISNSSMKISKIVHKAFIEVDEYGSKAAAATAGAGENRISSSPIDFKANRPFFVMIATTESFESSETSEPVTIFFTRFTGN